MEKELRIESIKVMLTKQEKEKIKQLADEQRLDISNYVRLKILK